ncbi:MAG: DUF2249 domain-containing protein [Verrucomicrobiota bacterium]
MKGATHNEIDLRRLDSYLIHPAIAQQAAHTQIDDSFWLISDHDPVELYEFLIDLGLTIQTFFVSENEFRVFLGKSR